MNTEELLAKAKKPSADAMKLHPFYRGKIETTLKCTVHSFDDFAIWYTPGVAAPCHNLKYDLHFLTRKGIVPAKIDDTMIAAYLCDENRELGLKPLSHSVLGMADLPSFGDLLKEAKKQKKAKKVSDVSIYDVDLAKLATYAARDTRLTLKLWDRLQYDLSQESMTDLFWNTEMPFVWVLLDMEQNGMHVNGDAVSGLRVEFEQELQQCVTRWNELTGGLNYNSNPQLRQHLFKTLKLPVQDKTESGDASVNALTLQRLDPLDKTGTVAALRGIRRIEKMVSTFITMLEEKPFDGYLHGNFNQTGTVTGRLSSSDPNQQNIPCRGELGKKIRSVFDAPSGHSLVVIDYSQIEMRMMAHESKDENLLYAFEQGVDVHQMTADRAGVKRSEAKALNFGWGYSMSYIGLLDAIEKAGQPRPSAADAKKWLRDYDQAYPTLVRWRNAVIKRALQLGYVPTVAGHRRHLPDLTATIDRVRSAAERQCVNARVQGSCADMLKWAMLQMTPWEKMYGAKTASAMALVPPAAECSQNRPRRLGARWGPLPMGVAAARGEARAQLDALPSASYGFSYEDHPGHRRRRDAGPQAEGGAGGPDHVRAGRGGAAVVPQGAGEAARATAAPGVQRRAAGDIDDRDDLYRAMEEEP